MDECQKGLIRALLTLYVVGYCQKKGYELTTNKLAIIMELLFIQLGIEDSEIMQESESNE